VPSPVIATGSPALAVGGTCTKPANVFIGLSMSLLVDAYVSFAR
jgi:hypothetical protein